jgi:hypothetical protein
MRFVLKQKSQIRLSVRSSALYPTIRLLGKLRPVCPRQRRKQNAAYPLRVQKLLAAWIVLVSRPRHRKGEGEVHPCHVEAVRKETCINPHIRDSGTQTRQRMGESGSTCPVAWNVNARPSRSVCVSPRLSLGNVFVNTSNERASIAKKRLQQTPLLLPPSNNNRSCGSITLQHEPESL